MHVSKACNSLLFVSTYFYQELEKYEANSVRHMWSLFHNEEPIQGDKTVAFKEILPSLIEVLYNSTCFLSPYPESSKCCGLDIHPPIPKVSLTITMASGTVPEDTLLLPDPENHSQGIFGLDSISPEHSISQVIAILSHHITSDASKLLPSRSINITFYNPLDNPFFSIKEICITAETLLEDLVFALQNLLDSKIAAEPLESLLIKKIQFTTSTDQSCDRFPPLMSQVKETSDGLRLNRECEQDQMGEMRIYWSKIRDLILLDDESLTQNIGTPMLKLCTVHKNLNAQPDSMVEMRITNTCKQEIATSTKPGVRQNDTIVVESLDISPVSDDSVIDKKELVYLKTVVDESKYDVQQYDISENLDSRDKEIVKSNLIEKPVTKRNLEKLSLINSQERIEKKENSSTDLLISKFPSLVRSPVKKQNLTYSHTSSPIKSPKNCREDQEVRGLNKTKAILSLQNLDHMKSTTISWPSCNGFVKDGSSVHDVNPEERMTNTTQSSAGRLTPKLAKELEIYRRSYESAISYANDDEEAFFPSSPMTKPKASTTREARPLFHEKRQMTQLDLDKIVKDAVVRKMNRSRNANPSDLANLNGNWNNEGYIDQMAFYSPVFTQDLSYDQEYTEFQQGENEHPRNLTDLRETMCGNDNLHSPLYYTGPYNQSQARMGGIIAETPYFMNQFNTQEAETLSHANKNLNFKNGDIDYYANNGYNTANLFDVAGGNYCAPRNSGGYFMDHGRYDGLDSGNNLNTRFFNNPLKFQDQFAWKRANTNVVY